MAVDREARPARPMRGKRRKVCQFCADKCESIDYKDAAKLRRSAEGLRRSSAPDAAAQAARMVALAEELERKRCKV